MPIDISDTLTIASNINKFCLMLMIIAAITFLLAAIDWIRYSEIFMPGLIFVLTIGLLIVVNIIQSGINTSNLNSDIIDTDYRFTNSSQNKKILRSMPPNDTYKSGTVSMYQYGTSFTNNRQIKTMNYTIVNSDNQYLLYIYDADDANKTLATITNNGIINKNIAADKPAINSTVKIIMYIIAMIVAMCILAFLGIICYCMLRNRIEKDIAAKFNDREN